MNILNTKKSKNNSNHGVGVSEHFGWEGGSTPFLAKKTLEYTKKTNYFLSIRTLQ